MDEPNENVNKLPKIITYSKRICHTNKYFLQLTAYYG